MTAQFEPALLLSSYLLGCLFGVILFNKPTYRLILWISWLPGLLMAYIGAQLDNYILVLVGGFLLTPIGGFFLMIILRDIRGPEINVDVIFSAGALILDFFIMLFDVPYLTARLGPLAALLFAITAFLISAVAISLIRNRA